MEALMLGLITYVALYPISIANACLKPGGMYFSLKDNKRYGANKLQSIERGTTRDW